jgi:hypothetical protein
MRPFLPFRLAFRVPESGRSGQGVSSVKKGVVCGLSATGWFSEKQAFFFIGALEAETNWLLWI